jgi:hypothetical protein
MCYIKENPFSTGQFPKGSDDEICSAFLQPVKIHAGVFERNCVESPNAPTRNLIADEGPRQYLM